MAGIKGRRRLIVSFVVLPLFRILLLLLLLSLCRTAAGEFTKDPSYCGRYTTPVSQSVVVVAMVGTRRWALTTPSGTVVVVRPATITAAAHWRD